MNFLCSEIFSQPEVLEHMDVDPCPSVEEGQGIIRWTQEIRDDDTGIRRGIRLRSDETLIGTCGFNAIVRERGSRAEIAYDLDPRFWGQGFMAEVMPTSRPTALKPLACAGWRPW